MIKLNLLLAEYMLKSDETENHERLQAIQSIKSLLEKIDFEAESIPMESEKKLLLLLSSLKKSPLNLHELQLVKDIMKY